MHTLYFPDLPQDLDTLIVEGEEARHASRVKRLGPGDVLRVFDGKGTIATCEIIEARRELSLRIVSRDRHAPTSPHIDVFAATPKGSRVDDMIDALAQVGAASWTPISTKLGVVDPRDTKLARLERIATEACKQACRPWLMPLLSKKSFSEAVRPGDHTLVLADAAGTHTITNPKSPKIRLLIGPEGGFTPDELSAAREAGAQFLSLGPNTLRIEMAAPVAVALLLAMARTTP